jgi:deoxyribonuclease V
MKIKHLHKWNLSYSKARQLQSALAAKVSLCPLHKKIKAVAAIDCAFSKDKNRICAAIVVMKLGKEFEVIETVHAIEPVTFPYIPGLLSFREGPVCLKAAEKLKEAPDVFIIDGQGTAHPRRLGLACHLGLFLDRPTIGCAKSRLTGTFEEPGAEKGDYSWLKDGKEIIGAVVRTRKNVKPVFVSVGNKCLAEDAVRITLECTQKFRLPEPSRLAHQMVSKLRSQI